MTERTLNSSPLRAAIGPFYAQKGQKIGACGGLTVSVSGLNAFLERVWAVGGCSAFSVPFIVCQAHLENDESQKMVLYYRESRSKVL